MPYAKIEGRELHYTDYPATGSSPSGLTLIFAHGLGSTQNYFGGILPYLNDRYRCILFDNYGAGRSRYYEDLYPNTSIDGIASDVLALLEHCKVDGDVVVVGYSMSGMVPTTIAARAATGAGGGAGKKGAHGAEKVVAGVCIGPVHPTELAAEIFKKRVATVKEAGMEAMANTIPGAATGPGATALQKSFIREMLLGQSAGGYIANCRAIETATPPDYANVNIPILLIAGDQDKSAPLSGVQHIHDNLATQNKKLEILDGIGHWLCVEDPDRIGKLVREWCDMLQK